MTFLIKLNKQLLIILSSALLIHSLSIAENREVDIVSQQDITEQLANISNDIKELQDKRAVLSKELKVERDEEHKKDLNDSLTRVNTQLKEYMDLFEKVSLGGIDITRFNVPAKDAIQQTGDYNWQKELIQIAQPVFTEMKKVTDAPRKRDILRLEKKEIEDRMAQLNKGLESLSQVNNAKLSDSAQKSLKEIQSTWTGLQKELEREHKLVLLKLNELTSKESFITRLTNGTVSFFTGRGLTLIITITTLSILLYGFRRLLVVLESREKNIVSTKWRVFILLYQIITTLIAVMVTLMMLYSSGDMVLFGIAILIILAFLVSSRNSLPKYYAKVRIFLNIGQAREGERVIYNDLPWKISRINLYTVYLMNPLLENGTIRLTIDHLNTMISRPIKMDEIWFPTIVNDVVLLPNGSQYRVLRQTPEYVYLTAGGTEMIYSSKDFIKDKVVNLSYGYAVSNEFSLNYLSVANKMDEIITTLQTELNTFIHEKNPDAHKFVKSITVDFLRLNESGSATFMLSISMGTFATDYRGAIGRLLQKGAINIAESNGWQVITNPTIILDNE